MRNLFLEIFIIDMYIMMCFKLYFLLFKDGCKLLFEYEEVNSIF